MPKETVYGQVVPATTSDQDDRQAVVDVHWTRDRSYVQIVTHIYQASPVVIKLPEKELNRVEIVSGSEFISSGCDGNEGHGDAEWMILSAGNGYYVDLDRESINRLIRNLRRARDQAFGRDE